MFFALAIHLDLQVSDRQKHLHSTFVWQEETFGPVIGIQKVSSDEAAIKLMNDSPYGLTASVWTPAESEKSQEAFLEIADQIQTGTVFLNRCDYLDPALAWTGVKDSGRGVSLSRFGESAVILGVKGGWGLWVLMGFFGRGWGCRV